MAYIKKLENWLQEIDRLVCEFISTLNIKEFRNNPQSGIFVLTHPYSYNKEISSDQKTRQIELKKAFIEWKEHCNLMIQQIPNDLKREIVNALGYIENQIELRSDWSTKPTVAENINEIKKQFVKISNFLKLYENAERIVLIPDTNSLILQQNLELYKSIAGEKIDILLIPTVLSELDRLKMIHRDEEFRKKVNKIINQIKGYRTQGSLSKGVTIFKTITVKMIATEPDFQKALSWLDKENNDDRIIAGVIQYQIENPSYNVGLVTADINLQNKAEMARISFFEPPSV